MNIPAELNVPFSVGEKNDAVAVRLWQCDLQVLSL